MSNSKLIKSATYKGIYWREVPRHDGLGMERMYYIRYRRGGRAANETKEPVGRSSEGMTEAKANRIRGARMDGKEQSNAEKRAELERANIAGSGPLTFARLWQLYSEATEDKASHGGDVCNYNNHLEKRLGKKLAADISTADIVHIRRTMESQNLSAQTVKHVLGQIRRILRHAMKLGIYSLPGNLVFEMPKVDNRKTENMTAGQLAAYWQALDEEPDQDAAAFLRMELLTGIRRGAMMALRWEDVDFEQGFITLRGDSAKNGKTARIPMSEAAKNVLQQVIRQSDFVFPGKDGGQRKCFRRMAQRVRDKAGLPADFRPNHGLRHTFASQLASSGKVDIHTLKQLMTHDSIAMTERYSHFADDALRRAANVAGEVLPLVNILNRGAK